MDDFDTVPSLGQRVILQPHQSVGERSGLCNWESDEDVIRNLLRRLRRIDSQAAEALQITDRVFETYVKTLVDARLLPDARERDEARARRIQQIRETIKTEEHLSVEIVQTLAKLDPIRISLERHKEETIREVREYELERLEEELGEKRLRFDDEIEQERERLGQELDGKRSEMSGLQEQISKAEKELQSLTQSIKERRQQLAGGIEQLDKALTKRLKDISQKSEEYLAEIITRNPLIQALTGGNATPASMTLEQAVEIKPFDSVDIEEGSPIKDVGELYVPLMDALAAADFDPVELSKVLHAGFVSGAVPILMGKGANEALFAYRACVAANRGCWIPISPLETRLEDLFLTDIPANAPTHGDFARTFLEAHRNPDRLHLVILDGINRAPVQYYFLPLLEMYSEVHSKRIGRHLPTMAGFPSGLRFWPPNLLMAATIDVDDDGLALPRRIWSSAVFIDCDSFSLPYLASRSNHPDKRSENFDSTHEIRFDTWNDWRRAATKVDLSPCSKLWERHFSEHSLPRAGLDNCLRLYAAAHVCQLSGDTALVTVCRNVMAPQAGELTDQLKESLQSYGVDDESVARLQRVVEMLG